MHDKCSAAISCGPTGTTARGTKHRSTNGGTEMSADETVIAAALPARPNPGGRLSVGGAASALPIEGVWEAICADRLSPLVAAALPLLDLCVRLKTSASH